MRVILRQPQLNTRRSADLDCSEAPAAARRTDRDVGTVGQAGLQGGDLAHRGRHVGVAEQDLVAVCRAYARPDGGSLAAVDAGIEHDHVSQPEAAHQLGGVVGRAVVGHHDLEVGRDVDHPCCDRDEGRHDAFGLVVRRDDDREFGGQ